MKKKLITVFSAFLFFVLPYIASAQGMAVFDLSGWLNGIDQLYEAYNMVTNTISQIENQYTQIQQAVEAARGIDWENIRFDGDFDIRGEIQDASKRVNQLLNSAKRIKDSIATPSINCGNVRYSIADLCGMTDPDENGIRKNMLTALTDYKNYMSTTMQNAVKGMVNGLDENQKKAIWTKYGISPSNYAFIQNAHTEVMKAASNVLANIGEEVVQSKYNESFLRTSNLIKAATQTVDSNGNITNASMNETLMYLFSDLSGHLAELETAMYTTAAASANKIIEDDAKELAEASQAAEAAQTNEAMNSHFSSRIYR